MLSSMRVHVRRRAEGRVLPAQTEQKAMWGQGLPGSEVTSLLGLLCDQRGAARSSEVDSVRLFSVQSGDLRWVCRGWMELQREDLRSDLRDTAFVRGQDLKSTSVKTASPARPLLLSPPPQRGKQQGRCSHHFMHDKTFCATGRVAKKTQHLRRKVGLLEQSLYRQYHLYVHMHIGC